MEYLSLLPATAIGYYALKATTYPTSKIRRKMPNIKTSRIQVFPVIRFYLFGRVIHFHHWMNFSILLILAMFEPGGILGSLFTKGVLLGGIIQGLSMPKEHRTMIYKDFSLERMTKVCKR